MLTRNFILVSVAIASFIVNCSRERENDKANSPRKNPFTEDLTQRDKADTAYINPDGIEVEVDIEADVEAPSDRIKHAPAELGQFAMTHLRKTSQFYLEGLAEDATSPSRVEWLVDDEWITAEAAAKLRVEKLKHFRKVL